MARQPKWTDGETKTMVLPRVVIEAKERSTLSWGDFLMSLIETNAALVANPEAVRLASLRNELIAEKQKCDERINDIELRIESLTRRVAENEAKEQADIERLKKRRSTPSSTDEPES